MSTAAHEIRVALRPVAARLKRRAALDLAARALTAGAAVAFVLAMARVSTAAAWPTIAALTVLVAAPLAGFVFGMLSPTDWSAAARAIDDRCRLDDRSITALAASHTAAPRAMARLVLRDALERLEHVKPGEVVKPRAPAGLASALGLTALALLSALVPTDWSALLPQTTPRASNGVAAESDEDSPAAASFDLDVLTATGPAIVGRSDGEAGDVLEQAETAPAGDLDDPLIVRRYFAPPAD